MQFTKLKSMFMISAALFVLHTVPPNGSAIVAAASSETEVESDEIIIRAGTRAITRKALEMRTKHTAQKRRRKPAADETAALVDRLAEQTLFAEEARAMGLDKDPTVQVLIRDTMDKLLAHLYVRRHLLPGVTVPEAEVVAYYLAHQHRWRQPETVRARHILFRVASRATAEEIAAVETRAMQIRQRLLAGEDFSRLAKEISEDTGTRNDGGDLGFFTHQGKVAAIADTAFALGDGEISLPVRTSVGYHIIQTIEHCPTLIKPLEAVSGEIRSLLLRLKKREAAVSDRRRLERKFKLYIHESYQISGGSNAP